MKTIIAGSRIINDRGEVGKALIKCGFMLKITEIVSGGAKGVDRLGESFAVELEVKVKQFLADWDTHGKIAGFIRNQEMANYADALIAVWDGESRGTYDMIHKAEQRGLRIYVHKIK